MANESIKGVVKARYGEAAKRVVQNSGGKPAGGAPSECGCSTAATPCCDPISSDLYAAGEVAELPKEAVAASLGCGNPTALAQLNAGETVLDLGSGGGIDGLLSARRVGPTGKAYGLDMTDEMLALARENQRKAGVENVEFLKGEIENIPLPENSVDVVISNCVINLSGDKDRVLREAFRVLRPEGRFAVSDVVVRGTVPAEIRRGVGLWLTRGPRRNGKPDEARSGRIRRYRNRADPRLQRSGRAAIPDGAGDRRGCGGTARGRQVRERVYSRKKAGERKKRFGTTLRRVVLLRSEGLMAKDY